MERPDPVDIEQVFAKFVKAQGGKIVSEMLPKGYEKPNADFVFSNPDVICELKCLQKDSFADEDTKRFLKLFEKWKSKGLLKDADRFQIFLGVIPLPPECVRELVGLVRRTIEQAVRHAKKQIHQTKKELGIPDAKGLLLLANDGNYFLPHVGMIKLIMELMMRNHMTDDSHIDGVVYFTVNQTAVMPGSEFDWQIWAPAYRSNNDLSLITFVDNIGFEFFNNFLPTITGQPLSAFHQVANMKEGICMINDLKHIPKEYTMKKNK